MSKKSPVTLIEKSLKTKFGDVFFNVDDLMDQRGQTVPTSLSLDIALKGGILDGTITYIGGKEGSGKTTLCLTVAANAQKLGKKIRYIDVENRLQPELLRTIPGLDLTADNFQIIKSSQEKFLTAEDYFNIIDTIVNTEPNIIVIIDSIAALCDSGAHTAEHGESKQMMSISKLSYGACRKWAQVLRPNNSSIIAITHIQANPSMYTPYNIVGGNAWKFFASNLIICLSSSEFPKQGDKIGRQSTFKVLKSALGPGTGEAEFFIKYNAGYYKEKDLINIGKDLGLIEAAGSWLSFKDSKGEEVKVQGEDSMVEWLQEHPEESEVLEKQIRELVLPKV